MSRPWQQPHTSHIFHREGPCVCVCVCFQQEQQGDLGQQEGLILKGGGPTAATKWAWAPVWPGCCCSGPTTSASPACTACCPTGRLD
eukprot:scaffold213187_cov14-Tisochrysis_lutea.AAC.1